MPAVPGRPIVLPANSTAANGLTVGAYQDDYAKATGLADDLVAALKSRDAAKTRKLEAEATKARQDASPRASKIGLKECAPS